MPLIESIDKDITPDKLELIEARFNRPIAGQSLTNDPDQPSAWEGPPKYTTVPEAALGIFAELTGEGKFMQLISALKEGFPVVDMANLILYRGFQTGQFSPDLMLLLLEPVIYMLLALAEKAGIGDVVGYDGEEEDDEGDPEEQVKSLRQIKQAIQLGGDKISEESIAEIPELKKEIAEFEVPESLLNRTQASEDRSLLEREK